MIMDMKILPFFTPFYSLYIPEYRLKLRGYLCGSTRSTGAARARPGGRNDDAQAHVLYSLPYLQLPNLLILLLFIGVYIGVNKESNEGKTGIWLK